MEWKKISPAEMAKLLRTTPTKVNQYAYGKTKPRGDMMMEISVVTEWHVNANDFFGTTREKVEQELLKRGKVLCK